ncbi:hypothetical protein AVEN_57135-1 [Araneus ventricosus]|uniref:Uncharacterized protein n=1 Tax=Araneus ventricosus TaxID=182803 RepID=A0A4Y2HA13_ARAVE|nr:hypothetical protein AVEN_57135-1 [Araneus ventricosus]
MLQGFSIETESLGLFAHLLNTARASWAVDLSLLLLTLFSLSASHLRMAESGLPAIRSCQLSERISLETKFQNRELVQNTCVQPCCCGQKTGHWEVCMGTSLLLRISFKTSVVLEGKSRASMLL